MTIQVEDIEKYEHYTSRRGIMNRTPTQLCQAVYITKSTSDKVLINSISNKNFGHSSRINLNSLTNGSPSKDRRIFFQDFRIIFQRVKENTSVKESFQKVKQWFHIAKDSVCGKAVQIFRRYVKKPDALCIQDQCYRTVICVPVKEKNVNNDPRKVIEVKPITINGDDENSAINDIEETYERLDCQLSFEKEVENEKEREIFSVLKGDYERYEHSGVCETDQSEFISPGELDPSTRQMYDNIEEPLTDEFENCDEKLSWTMEENEVLERERMYELMEILYALQNEVILGGEGRVEGHGCSDLTRPRVGVEQTEHKLSGSEVARESVKGKKTAKTTGNKMGAIGERWEEQAKECKRKFVREQASKTEPLEDQSKRDYGGNIPKPERKEYGRNEEGIDRQDDTNGDSTLVKCNDKGVKKEVQPREMRSFKDTRQEKPQEEEQRATRKTARTVQSSKVRRRSESPDARRVTKTQDSDILITQRQVDGGCRTRKRSICQYQPPTVCRWKNRSFRGKTRKPKKRPKEYIRGGPKVSEITMLHEMSECLSLLPQVFISMSRQFLPQKDTPCWKSTSVRKPRQTGDDVHKCELGVGMLLDHAGDSNDTYRNKREIVYEMNNNPNNRKALYRLASRYLPGWRDFELQQLMTGDDSPEKVIREFKHQGLTIGHLVKYYNDDFTCRDDILCLIDKIHQTCVYCCPNKNC